MQSPFHYRTCRAAQNALAAMSDFPVRHTTMGGQVSDPVKSSPYLLEDTLDTNLRARGINPY